MSKFVSTLSAFLVMASGALAQAELNPTHVSAFGEITATLTARMEAGSGTLENPGTDIDVEVSQGFGTLEGAVGLGMGFEAELSIPYQYAGTAEGDAAGTEFEETTVGLFDPILRFNYQATPQVMLGLTATTPVGADDVGQTETKIGGVTIQDGKDAGPGDGIVRIGARAGLNAGLLYAMIEANFATAQKEDGDAEVDLPTNFVLVAGLMIPAGTGATVDIRATANYIGEEVTETLGVQETEEAHAEMQLQVRFYYTVGGRVTLIVGAGASWIQDHAIEEESDLDLTGLFTYGAELGVQVSLGA